MVVLKLLSEARRDGDPILATIRGSAVNQDGRSTGLTTPNVLAQQALLRQALEDARLSAEDIGYVEAHGTGTSLGDPIEVDALRAVLGGQRPAGAACVLGAVKTNIGHLEAAAGIAGLIKAVMALRQEMIPRNLHFRALNPRISLEGTPFVIPTENRPWKRGEAPRLAGVSSFGMSGTNAHVILEEAPTAPAAPAAKAPEASSYLLPLSARSPEALLAFARSYRELLAASGGSRLSDIAYTASLRRTHHEHRISIVGHARAAEIAAALAALARNAARRAGSSSSRAASRPRPARRWCSSSPARDRSGRAWRGSSSAMSGSSARRSRPARTRSATRGSFSVLEELAADEGRSRLAEIQVVQPLLFAIEVALAALWRSWGVEPDCVIGHSMGEVAAAHVAGILDLEDAAKVICRRSKLLRRVSGEGAMALVELGRDVAAQALAGHEDRLAVAVSNGPRSTVISGDPEALDEVLSTLEARGVFCRRVKVDVASHSPQMDPLRDPLLAELRNVRPHRARLNMRSTVTAEALKGPECGAGYWVQNLREPVLFSSTVQRLMDERHTLFVEMSPHPILLPADRGSGGGFHVHHSSIRRWTVLEEDGFRFAAARGLQRAGPSPSSSARALRNSASGVCSRSIEAVRRPRHLHAPANPASSAGYRRSASR